MIIALTAVLKAGKVTQELVSKVPLRLVKCNRIGLIITLILVDVLCTCITIILSYFRLRNNVLTGGNWQK